MRTFASPAAAEADTAPPTTLTAIAASANGTARVPLLHFMTRPVLLLACRGAPARPSHTPSPGRGPRLIRRRPGDERPLSGSVLEPGIRAGRRWESRRAAW